MPPINAFADRQDEAAVQDTATAVKAGSNTLVTNSYAANNGLLEKQTYGNDFTVGHGYDTLDRETSRSYNGKVKFYWAYNADGNLARYTEVGGRVLTYIYDNIGRLLQVSGDDGSYVKTSYDKLDKSTRLRYKFNGQRRDIYFDYSSKDNLPLRVKFGTNSAYAVENSYDDLTRLSGKTYTVAGNNEKLKTAYTYKDLDSNAERTTGTVKGIDYTYVEGGLTTYNRWYDYDGIGNIVAEYERKDGKITARERYVYDAKNQLVRHNSATQKCTITYSYDAGGNITAKNIYAYTIAESLEDKTPNETIVYTYGNDAWKDELTSYGNESIEYDKIGNPTLYRGWGMTWQGRQLAGASKDGTSLSYTYDSDGIRTSKTVGTVKTSYLLNGTQILAQTTNGKTLSFFYDQQGNRVAMADSSNHIYYYLYNLQGDVIALADGQTGKLAATYTYDAWGKCTVTNATGFTIGTDNPFRYRGYYYDSETELYYLQSRYYDAETGRFINADSQLNPKDGVLGCNLFAYCGNNPIINHDPNGHFFFGALIGGIIGGAAGALSASLKGKSIKAGFLTGAASGAAIGLVCDVVATGGMSAAVGVALCGVISAAGNVANQYANYKMEKNPNSNTGKAKNKANAKSASEYKSFAEYVDVKSIAVSSIAAMTFAPLSIGANKVVNIAFEGVEATGLSGFTAQLIANSAMGGSVSILQSIIDFF